MHRGWLVVCIRRKAKIMSTERKILLVTWYYSATLRLIADVLKTIEGKFYRFKSVLNRLELCVGFLDNQRQFQHGTHSASEDSSYGVQNMLRL